MSGEPVTKNIHPATVVPVHSFHQSSSRSPRYLVGICIYTRPTHHPWASRIQCPRGQSTLVNDEKAINIQLMICGRYTFALDRVLASIETLLSGKCGRMIKTVLGSTSALLSETTLPTTGFISAAGSTQSLPPHSEIPFPFSRARYS